MVCVKMLISGKVQGVSFRFCAHEQATKLKLMGFVRNLPDSRVEILVAGPQNKVNELVDWAKKGSPGAKVQNVEVIEVSDNIPVEPFYIRYDGGAP